MDLVICDTSQTWDGLVLKVTRVQAMNILSALVITKKIYMYWHSSEELGPLYKQEVYVDA